MNIEFFFSVSFRIPIEYGDFQSRPQYLVYNGKYGQGKILNLDTFYAVTFNLIQPIPDGIFQAADKSFLSCTRQNIYYQRHIEDPAKIKYFCKNSHRPLAVHFFPKKLHRCFHVVLNMPLETYT